MVYLDKLESSNTIQLVSAVGQTMPLHSTSLGKAMLAALPEDEFEAKLAQMDFVPPDRTDHLRPRRSSAGRSTGPGAGAMPPTTGRTSPSGPAWPPPSSGATGAWSGAISVAGPHFRVRDHFEEFGSGGAGDRPGHRPELGAGGTARTSS